MGLRRNVILGAVLSVALSPAALADAKDEPRRQVQGQAALDMVGQLLASKAVWSGPHSRSIVSALPSDGRLLLIVDGPENAAQIRKQIPAAYAPFTDVVAGGAAPVSGPSADSGGWSGGIWLSSSLGNCTAGFGMRHWSTGVVMLSTAKHCLANTWTNNSRTVGTDAVYGGSGLDIKLLRPAPGTSVNADVWIRGSGGVPTLRTVQSAGINAVGDAFGFYGRKSGGGSGKIIARYGSSYDTDAKAVRLGDSGGPVYVTHSNGNVQARGAVTDALWIDRNGNRRIDEATETVGMRFVDITSASSVLQASIVTI